MHTAHVSRAGLSALAGLPALALTLALFAAGCTKDEAKASPGTALSSASAATSGALPHNTVSVDQGLLANGRIVLGAVEQRAPRGEQRVPGEVRSSESGNAEAGTLVSGRVATLEVAEGAHVKRGQILAWIDAPEVGRAAAEVLRARARAGVAGRKLARQLDLDKQQATSANAVDDARAEDVAARADLLAARTLLSSLGGVEPPADSERELAIVRVPVRAPIDGVIERRDAVLGAPVSPDHSLFRLVAATRATPGKDAGGTVAVLARIPESSGVPAPGTVATLWGRGEPRQSCQGTATGTLGAIDEATRTTSMRIEPDAQGCAWLTPGGYVDVVFPRAATTKDSALVVPREAVVDVGGVPCAFVSGARPGEFIARPLRVRAGDGPDLVVESGLAVRENIAVKGALLLKGEMMRAELGQ